MPRLIEVECAGVFVAWGYIVAGIVVLAVFALI